jgi:hypothetical protein
MITIQNKVFLLGLLGLYFLSAEGMQDSNQWKKEALKEAIQGKTQVIEYGRVFFDNQSNEDILISIKQLKDYATGKVSKQVFL